MEDVAASLPLTGERTVPGVPKENYWYRRHEAAYAAITDVCRDAVVLEAGCGEGYGADLLASVARSVVALDYDQATITHVRRAYPRVRAIRGNLVQLPLANAGVDVVASLQTIEHLWDQEAFLAECARVLRPGGQLVVTTPNRITFSPGRVPLNPFHTRELSPAELAELLVAAGLRVDWLGGLHHGPRLDELDERHDGSLVRAQIVASIRDEWTPALLADVAAVRRDDFLITDEDVEASIDLVAIAVRR